MIAGISRYQLYTGMNPGMDTAQRIFAGEFGMTDYCFETDDIPNAVTILTPGGALCSCLYIVGACTDIIPATGGGLQFRLADPTGAFPVHAGREHPAVLEALRDIRPPVFIAVRGFLRHAGRKKGGTPVVRPESAVVVDRCIRDLWVLRTADRTLDRLELLQAVRNGDAAHRNAERAIAHYGAADGIIRTLSEMVEAALATVRDAPDPVSTAEHRTAITSLIRDHGGSRGIPLTDLLEQAGRLGLDRACVESEIEGLLADGECYMPTNGHVKLL